MIFQREQKRIQALQRICRTADGQLFFKMLQEDLIHLDALDTDPHMVYYNLGKRDYIYSLLRATKLELKELNINFEEGETQNG